MRTTLGLLGLAAALALGGCNDGVVGGGPPSLLEPQTLTATGELATSHVSLHVDNYLFDAAADVRLPLDSIGFVARLGDDAFVIDELVLGLGTINVSPTAMPPAGLRLRQVALSLMPAGGQASFPLRMFGHKAERVDATARMPFEIRWKLELSDGSLFDLGPGTMAPLDVILTVTTTPGAEHPAKLTLAATCKGTCWELPNMLAFADGGISVEAPLLVETLPGGVGGDKLPPIVTASLPR